MILSFHPCFTADQNMLCAGRDPDASDADAIKKAEAVILPQGCKKPLYEMARAHCGRVFPNYDARFKYPGKLGQTHLFRDSSARYPKTELYENVTELSQQQKDMSGHLFFGFPFVFKFDWGGEGTTVFLIRSVNEYKAILNKACKYEKTGQTGFLLQEYVPSHGRTLRVVVIGETLISYWRVQANSDGFGTSIAQGAAIDHDAYPEQQQKAVVAVKEICKKTGINLAGFDLMFSSEDDSREPYFLEINYFFGRRGLGGSKAFYRLLNIEIDRWLQNL